MSRTVVIYNSVTWQKNTGEEKERESSVTVDVIHLLQHSAPVDRSLIALRSSIHDFIRKSAPLSGVRNTITDSNVTTNNYECRPIMNQELADAAAYAVHSPDSTLFWMKCRFCRRLESDVTSEIRLPSIVHISSTHTHPDSIWNDGA